MQIAGLLMCVVWLSALGCSSLPLFSDSANLATVAYVNEADRANLENSLPTALDSALVEDRKQIAQLQQRALSQEGQLEEARRQLEELSKALDGLSAEMQSQAETFRSLAKNLQATAMGLDEALTALPADTLRLFSDALQKYLASLEVPSAPPVESDGSPAPEATEGG